MSIKTRKQLQQFLKDKGHYSGDVDGIVGSNTKKAILACFQNKKAAAITDQEKLEVALSLGDKDLTRIKAVAKVEASGSGWFNSGHPKILYERHKFWKHNDDASAPVSTYFNYASWGNYTTDANNNDINDSYDKLLKACEYDPRGAFMAVSMGSFQIMGEYYQSMGYDQPWEMLYDMTHNEKSHYLCLAKYIQMNNGQSKFLALSPQPNDCRPFALMYNGSQYAKHNYHGKLAAAVKHFQGK